MKLQSIREMVVEPIFLINLVLNVETKEVVENEEEEAILNDERNTGEDLKRKKISYLPYIKNFLF